MKLQSILSAILILLFLSACDLTDSTYSDAGEMQKNAEINALNNNSGNSTILEIAADNEDFSILAEAVVFAGLDGTLDGRRQFTVFAPTNDAFEALLDALELTADELFVEENKELVKEILLYHVAPGNRDSEAVTTADQINTLQGYFIKVNEDNGSFFVGNDENGFAQITDVDINASNGVIHVIDAVMLPPSEKNAGDSDRDNGNDDNGDNGNDKPDDSILDIASSVDDFSILAEAVVFAGIADDLDGKRQFTVFAPTNDAFENLLEALELTAEELFSEGNEGLVRDILLYHVAPGNRAAEDVVTSSRIRTISKSFIFVNEENGDFFVGNENGFAQIIDTDIFARNGVIHVIDAVMLP